MKISLFNLPTVRMLRNWKQLHFIVNAFLLVEFDDAFQSMYLIFIILLLRMKNQQLNIFHNMFLYLLLRKATYQNFFSCNNIYRMMFSREPITSFSSFNYFSNYLMYLYKQYTQRHSKTRKIINMD